MFYLITECLSSRKEKIAIGKFWYNSRFLMKKGPIWQYWLLSSSKEKVPIDKFWYDSSFLIKRGQIWQLWLLIRRSCEKAKSTFINLIIIPYSRQWTNNSHASRCFIDDLICINLLHRLHDKRLASVNFGTTAVFC